MMALAMVTVIADFNALSDYPAYGIRQGIPLGYAAQDPDRFRDVADGQAVYLVAPDLIAEGRIRRIATPQGDYLYGCVTGFVRDRG